MFRSILNLRKVLQSSAHWLILMDKKRFSPDPSNSFLMMVTTCFDLSSWRAEIKEH